MSESRVERLERRAALRRIRSGKPDFWAIAQDGEEFLVDFGESVALWGTQPKTAMKWPGFARSIAETALKLLDRPEAYLVPIVETDTHFYVLWPDRP